MRHQTESGDPSSMASESAWSVATLDRKDRECITVLAESDLSGSWFESPWYRVSPSKVAEILGKRINPLLPDIAATAVEYDDGSRSPQFAQRVLLSPTQPYAKELIRAGFDAIEEDDSFDPHTAFNWLLRAAPQLGPGLDEVRRGTESPNVQTRVASVYLMGAIRRDAATSVPILIRSTKDARVLVRYRAAKALALFGADARQSIPALQRLRRDDYASVRRAAALAIEAIDVE